MATRFYLSSVAAGISPTFNGSWEATGAAVRRMLDTVKQSEFETLTVACGSTAGPIDVLVAQYVSAPLSGDQTISGAIKGQLRTYEDNAALDARMQCVIWVRKADGTSRGTLVASDTSALASEFATSLTNREVPLGSPVTPSSVAALSTDRIVVEIGYRKHEAAATNRNVQMRLGAPSGTDLPEDETDTTDLVPWIEFADTLTFTAPTALVTQVATEVLDQSTAVKALVTQVATEVLDQSTAVKALVTQVAVEVLANFPRFYVNAVVTKQQKTKIKYDKKTVWYDETGGTSDIWRSIDEATPDDADYITTLANPTAAIYEGAIYPIEPPLNTTAHILRVRHFKVGDRTSSITAELFEAGGVRATMVLTPTTTPTTVSYTLTGAEAAAITDYHRLFIRFTGATTGGGSSTTLAVSWFEFETVGATSTTHQLGFFAMAFISPWFTSNAVIEKTITVAGVTGETPGPPAYGTVDAVIEAAGPTQRKLFYAEAWIAEAFTGVWDGPGISIDALISGPPVVSSLTANAVVLKTSDTLTATANAVIKKNSGTLTATANAIVKKTMPVATFTAAAAILKTQASSLTANAVIFRTQTPTFAANSVLLKTQASTFSANAVVKKTITPTFAADAIIAKTLTPTFAANAVLAKSASGTFAANAVFAKPASGTFTAAAIIGKTQLGSLTFNAVIKASVTGTKTADAIRLRTFWFGRVEDGF